MDEQCYLNLLSKVLSNGEVRQDRNGKIYSLFGEKLNFNLKNGFPLLTTKKISIKNVAKELFWFLRGSTDFNELNLNNYTTKQFLDSVNLTFFTPGHCWRSFGGTDLIPGVDQIKYILEELTTNPHGRQALISAWNPCQLKLTIFIHTNFI